MRIFHSAYIRNYARLKPFDVDAYQRWLPIVAAARLTEGIPELQDWLIARAQMQAA